MMLVIRPPGRQTRAVLATLLGLLRAGVYLVGGIIGAVVVLSLAWAIGKFLSPSGPISFTILIVASLALAARDAGLVAFHLPQRRGQVKRETALNHPIGGLLLHGFALGTAFYTFIPVSLPYIIFVAPVTGLLNFETVAGIGFFFALGRSLPVFARMFLRGIDADHLGYQLMTRGLPIARTISVVVLGALAGAMTSTLLHVAGYR